LRRLISVYSPFAPRERASAGRQGPKKGLRGPLQGFRRDLTGCGRAASKGPKTVQRAALASATVRAVMFTTRRTVAEAVRMCTGLAAPSNTGPMAMPPPAAVFSRL